MLQQHDNLLYPLTVLMHYTLMGYLANCDFCFVIIFLLFTFPKQTEGPILKLSSNGKNNLYLKASLF